jgi:hypothetical protein
VTRKTSILVAALLVLVAGVRAEGPGGIVPISAGKVQGGQGSAAPPEEQSITTMLIPVSTSTTRTDEELMEEFLHHTHAHTHRDYEAKIADLVNRITRLEERVNQLVTVLNHYMAETVRQRHELKHVREKVEGPSEQPD